MNDWFEWNGRRCTEYGIHVLEQPLLTLPNERATFVDVPGRSGSLTVLEGDAVYDDLVLTARCIVENPARYAEIAAYLKGGGKADLCQPGAEGYYEARIINQIPFEKILRGNPHLALPAGQLPLQALLVPEERSRPFTLTRSGSFVENPGAVSPSRSSPCTATGAITLMVGMSITELGGT